MTIDDSLKNFIDGIIEAEGGLYCKRERLEDAIDALEKDLSEDHNNSIREILTNVFTKLLLQVELIDDVLSLHLVDADSLETVMRFSITQVLEDSYLKVSMLDDADEGGERYRARIVELFNAAMEKYEHGNG